MITPWSRHPGFQYRLLLSDHEAQHRGLVCWELGRCSGAVLGTRSTWQVSPGLLVWESGIFWGKGSFEGIFSHFIYLSKYILRINKPHLCQAPCPGRNSEAEVYGIWGGGWSAPPTPAKLMQNGVFSSTGSVSGLLLLILVWPPVLNL